MKSPVILAFAVALMTAVVVGAEDTSALPEMPPPVKQHEWLQQFVGKWDVTVEVTTEPGKPPIRGKGSESTRMLGGFWVIAEGKGEMEGTPGTINSLLTLGFDANANKFVGTWIDSINSYLWKYEGKLDAARKVLTLETQGPCPLRTGLVRFREVTEFKSKDHRVFTSSMLGEDGRWVTMVTAHYRRKR
jgi:hypothetical protein